MSKRSSETQEITVVNDRTSLSSIRSLKKIESIIPYDNNEERINKSNCKLCQSEYRDEAELEFDKTPNYLHLTEWLNQKGLDVSYPAVRNHILHHYKYDERKDFMLEYAEDIKRWAENCQDKVSSIKNRIGLLSKQMTEIASQSEDLKTIDEKRKSAETTKKLAECILTHEEKLDQYEKSMEPITLIFQQLKIIISDEMKQNNSEEAKRVLLNVLEKIQKSDIANIIVESN